MTNYYYACVARYSKEHDFTLLYGEHGNGFGGKLAVVTNKAEAEIVFRRAFPHISFNDFGIVDITKLVKDGIILVEKLEVLELVVKRSL